jgi:hypothetical protein
LVALDFVIDAQLFEHPEYALGTGVVQMVNDEHGSALRVGRNLFTTAAGRGRG